MACGEKRDVLTWKWTTCHRTIHYPCNLEYCTRRVDYICGFKWCKGWLGIPYPCGIKWCEKDITYLCGFEYCKKKISYPCYIKTLAEKYCYDFYNVNESCYGAIKFNIACCDGKQYRFRNACLGYWTANVQKTECFDSPLKSEGKCEFGESLPIEDVPGTIRTISSLNEGKGVSFKGIDLGKFGVCKKCMLLSALFFMVSVLGLGLADNGSVVNSLFKIFTGITSLFFLLHLTRYFYLKLRFDTQTGDCGCNK